MIDRTLSKEEAILLTKQSLNERKTIFQAHFEFDQFFTIIECLEYDEKKQGWVIWDFRPVGSLKLDILRSFFYHKRILEGIGESVVGNKLIRINSKYEREEKITLDSYLVVQDLNDKLKSEEETRLEEWERFTRFRNEAQEISFLSEFATCRSSKSCISPDHCFSGLSKNFEVFDLRDGNENLKLWFKEGFDRFSKLPFQDLSPNQKIQVEAHASGKIHLDKVALLHYFQNVTETVAFLDFESTNPYIPIFPKSRPFQHLPYLYSLHIWNTKTNELVHKTFIEENVQSDPRPTVLNALQRDLPRDITVFSFNDFFEKLIIEETSLAFPEFFPFWSEIKGNFIDLALPFKRFWVYHPNQNGKASLKEILPAFSEESHRGLSIRAGQDANYQYLRLIKKQVTEEEKKRVLEDLIAYCKLDSYGLFLIYRMLRELISVSQC